MLVPNGVRYRGVPLYTISAEVIYSVNEILTILLQVNRAVVYVGGPSKIQIFMICIESRAN